MKKAREREWRERIKEGRRISPGGIQSWFICIQIAGIQPIWLPQTLPPGGAELEWTELIIYILFSTCLFICWHNFQLTNCLGDSLDGYTLTLKKCSFGWCVSHLLVKKQPLFVFASIRFRSAQNVCKNTIKLLNLRIPSYPGVFKDRLPS